MKYKKYSLILRAAALIILIGWCVTAASAQPAFKVLYTFAGSEFGPAPSSAPIFDAAGNLYGTAVISDLYPNPGYIYKLAPNPGGTWTLTNLYRFTGSTDGATPQGTLIFDAAGDLYGVATYGGVAGAGLVFKLTPNPDGTWTQTVLYSFTGSGDGANPVDGLVQDAAGNLYGTASSGGASAAGVVFKLAPNPDGSWTESVLYSFTGNADGASPLARLIFDKAGNLYGTATAGGTRGAGVVFELTPNPDGTWAESVLFSFLGGATGKGPYAPLLMDAAGNLYGTTFYGGVSGVGIVFRLEKKPDSTWRERVLHQFTGGTDGSHPDAGLIFDRSGTLYGTTEYGGDFGYGVVFKLEKGTWAEHVLHAFNYGVDGGFSTRIVFDKTGNLFGTAFSGGSYGYGTVFEIER